MILNKYLNLIDFLILSFWKVLKSIKKHGYLITLKKIKHLITQPAKNTKIGWSHNPLVSLLIVSYKSLDDLLELFGSLKEQSYSNFEIVIVNNSEEDLECLKSLIKQKVLILNGFGNIGFAAATNLASEYSTGEVVMLCNPDVYLEEDCILNSVSALRHNINASVVVPKIRFYKRFYNLHVNSDADFNIDLMALENSLQYKKWFIREGGSDSKMLFSKNGNLVISLPFEDKDITLRFLVNHAVKINIYEERNKVNCISLKFNNEQNIYIYNPFQKNVQSPFWLINNAGSDLNQGRPFDIGFADYDYGHFDNQRYVTALCGCVALIRREILLKRKIFIDEFFAYFEDSELSLWLKNNNYRILYVPSAIVRHKHSASSIEGSPKWLELVNRSRKIFDSIYQINYSKKSLIIDSSSNYNSVSVDLNKLLTAMDVKIKKSNAEDLYSNNHKTIGIYNSYWNTYGGGEFHALSFAEKYKNFGKVYLLAENDFDIEKLQRYFNIDLSGVVKLVVPEISTSYTKNFDIFINSTFRSTLISEAKKSYFIVSFPHKTLNKKFIESYNFLTNSKYTQKWVDSYWPGCVSEVIYPILNNKIPNHSCLKVDSILTVGRFTRNGHAKRHDIVIRSFKLLIDSGWKLSSDLELNIVGSIDFSNQDDNSYYEELIELSNGYNINFYPNCDRTHLSDLYEKSLVYIHATGIDIDSHSYPEKLEHFGISVFEAIAYGCIPVVYDLGGPSELISTIGLGYTYHNISDLVNVLKNLFRSKDYELTDTLKSEALDFSIQNSIKFNKLIEMSLK